jgi:hypothetical protein
VTAEAPASPRWPWRVAQVVLTVAVVVWAGVQLWRQWTDASRENFQFDLRIGPLVLATALVGATYAMLIEVWRMVLARLGAPVAYGPAARVWFASNLGKYIPGKIWTVTAMVVMMAKAGVPSAKTGASVVVIAIAQAASGFAVVIMTSLPALREITGGVNGVIAATVGMALCLLAAPILARQWNRIAVRLGREQLSVEVPLSAVGIALAGTAISWWLYGIAFKLLVMSVLGTAIGPTSDYVAAYTSSYLVGLLALFAPGGLGAREVALSLVLPALGLATQAQAAVITVVSRLWLTVVELVPSVIAAVRSTRAPMSS